MGNVISNQRFERTKKYKANILHLPNEIILHIFSFISREELFWTVGLTCKKWFDICCETLNYQIEVKEDFNAYTLDSKSNFFIQDIKSSHNFPYLLQELSKYVEVLDLINHLVIWWYPEEYIALHESLNQNFTKPTKYWKESCIEAKPSNVFGSDLVLLFKSDPWKRMVHTNSIEHRKNLLEIVKLAKKLINLKGIFWKETQSYSNIKDTLDDLLKIVDNNKYLRFLTLCNFGKCDINYERLFQRCPGITTLDLSLSHNVTDETISYITNYCCELQHLDLTLCSKVTDEGFRSISKLACLKSLMIGGCNRLTDDGIEYVLKTFEKKPTSILHFDVSFCSNITDISLYEKLWHLNNLECLILANCQKITNDGIKHVTSSSTKLKVIVLEDCKNLTDQSLSSIASNCKDLSILNLNCISNITNNGILSICNGCPKLEILETKDAFRLTNIAFEAISQCLLNLVFLNLNCCKQLSDGSLQSIVRNCVQLRVLDIRWKCNELTKTGIKFAIAKNRFLKRLYFANVNEDTKNVDEEHFRNECRKVKTMIYQSKQLYFKCFTMD